MTGAVLSPWAYARPHFGESNAPFVNPFDEKPRLPPPIRFRGWRMMSCCDFKDQQTRKHLIPNLQTTPPRSPRGSIYGTSGAQLMTAQAVHGCADAAQRQQMLKMIIPTGTNARLTQVHARRPTDCICWTPPYTARHTHDLTSTALTTYCTMYPPCRLPPF